MVKVQRSIYLLIVLSMRERKCLGVVAPLSMQNSIFSDLSALLHKIQGHPERMLSSLHDSRKEVAGGSVFLCLQSSSPLHATRVKPQLLFQFHTSFLCHVLFIPHCHWVGWGPLLSLLSLPHREGYSLRMKKLAQDKHLSQLWHWVPNPHPLTACTFLAEAKILQSWMKE